MTDQEIDQELKDSNICPHCGGLMHTTTQNDDEHDEIYTLDVCEDCGYME